MSVLLVTSLGDIVLDLYTHKCPLTCKNFLKLCKIKYYNGCLFHTIQKDFIAQTGDPTGTGLGGDSIYKFLYGDQARFFKDEIHLDLKHSKIGTVSMANAGENLNSSQFYFTLRDDLDYLDGKHTVFGEIAEGFETLKRINEAYVDEKNRPYKNIRIKHTYILEDPFDDPSQLSRLIPDASPDGKRSKDEVDHDDDVRLEDDWVPMDEQLNASELNEIVHAKEAHSSAVVLESIGDIPDAEMNPPDNVLFVCKLNPVTQDEDLQIIFSRFGSVLSAEIIRDLNTGASLCYAFVEFQTKQSCEEAYEKMANSLIDDRRIHVDFSQSVAKLWSGYKRKGKGAVVDHIAKGGPATQLQPSKEYILKDNQNAQHWGGSSSRNDMVFSDGDIKQKENPPRHGKRHRPHDFDFNERMYRRVTNSSDANAGNRKIYADNNRRHHDDHIKRSATYDDKYADEKGAKDYWKKSAAGTNKRKSRNESSHRESGAKDHGYKYGGSNIPIGTRKVS